MKRALFLALWLGASLALAWFPPLNAAVKGEPPTHWQFYTGSMAPVRISAPLNGTPRGSALPVTEPTSDPFGGRVQAGIASWFCRGASRCTRGHPSGMYAAIRRDLLFLRGRTVQVCASRCLSVTIIDCNCGPHANLIDLYADAFEQLAPLSRGRLVVELRY